MARTLKNLQCDPIGKLSPAFNNQFCLILQLLYKQSFASTSINTGNKFGVIYTRKIAITF